MGCEDCPSYIKATVAKPVEKALRQVRAVRALTDRFNNLISELSAEVITFAVNELTPVVNAIPDPPTLLVSEVVGLLTCPLLPLALAIDPSLLSTMDPQSIINRIKRQLKDYIEDITKNYNDAVAALSSAKNIKIGARFLADVKRLKVDEEIIATAAASTAYVKSVCPRYYNQSGSVYKAFDDEIASFSMTGFIPSNLSSTIQPLLSKVQEAELKLEAWRLLASS